MFPWIVLWHPSTRIMGDQVRVLQVKPVVSGLQLVEAQKISLHLVFQICTLLHFKVLKIAYRKEGVPLIKVRRDTHGGKGKGISGTVVGGLPIFYGSGCFIKGLCYSERRGVGIDYLYTELGDSILHVEEPC